MSLVANKEIELIKLLQEELDDKARSSHLEFMRRTWVKGATDPFTVGFHTKKICERIDRAFVDFRAGVSSCIMIAVHPRSGKSDITSRHLGPHFLGEFPDKEVMQVTYQSKLASTFSAYGRNILRGEKYKSIYPNLSLSTETNQKSDWLITDSKGVQTGGRLYAAGLQSGLTGNGYHLGILDDYFSGRAEAESRGQRDNAWESFTNDFITRAAPVSITIILATQWHEDDINGRIKKQMVIDENFPKFDFLTFPAKASDYKGDGKYSGEYLFEERFSKKWYLEKYAVLGKYSSSALFDCNPLSRTGGRFNLENIIYYDKTPSKPWIRAWDLAHTAKQRAGDDPDYTSGTKLCFEYVAGDPLPHLWVDHVYRTRESASKRDEQIKAIVDMDGVYIKQYVESSIDSKDAFEYLKKTMRDIAFAKVDLSGKGDKATRATPLEAIFESIGHVHVRRGEWNNDWADELIRFDGLGKAHDDQVDNLSSGYLVQGRKSTIVSDEIKAQMIQRNNR